MFRRWLHEFLVAPLVEANDEARDFVNGPAGRRADVKVLTVLISVAVLLTVQYYVFSIRGYPKLVWLLQSVGLTSAAAGLERLVGDPHGTRLEPLLYWACGCIFTYVVVPALIVKLVFRERLRDYGVKLRGSFRDGWIYVLMFAVVGPLVWIVSRSPEFQATYPFFEPLPWEPLWPRFWIWELFYILQFLALEFFFRGYMIQGLRHRFGAYAIPVMMVPYCMIHYQKPMPEATAAIIAGLALGFMSLKTRSILLGAVIHVTVALSMDFASLYRRGYFD